MSTDLCRIMLEDFLKNSWSCVEALVKELETFREERRAKVPMFYFKNGWKNDVELDGSHFFLRASVEYSNPQLTVEEVQGIIAARFLEASGNYFHQHGLAPPTASDIEAICRILKESAEEEVVAYLLNTDDIEPDRYSMNPLKESVVTSGQSAFPCGSVTTEKLEIDQKFVQKYEGSLISKSEVERIAGRLHSYNSYMNMVDAAKYEHLQSLSEAFGIDLRLLSLRMPLTTLSRENTEGLLHYVIREAHKDYGAIECIYKCMGRSMKNLTTLLTMPHSKKGFGSKRTAKGRIHFEGTKLKDIKVDYRTALLYPNAIDPSDISIAQADDSFTVEGEKLMNYDFKEYPSSPQFVLYSLASPENAVLWHGIGAFGASELLKSYTTTRLACAKEMIVKGLNEKYGVSSKLPLQFNLVPKHMWVHPVHRNIDASIGCVENLKDLADQGIRTETLPADQYTRKVD